MAASIVQKLALAIYRQPLVTMMRRTSVGAALFVRCYDFYKDIFEVPGNHALARRIVAGSWVIDVGANNGFFTERFAQWVNGSGRVIAIEPESANLALLKRRVSAKGLTTVDIHQVAAMERSGPVHLQINPERPDDHRIGDFGEIVVAGVTLDELVEQAGNPMIGLIKIDTQGSEHRVLAGARKTLQRCRPNLFIEIDDRALHDGGASAAELVHSIETLGYEFFTISRRGREIKLQAKEISESLMTEQRGYLDVLCIPAQ